MRSRNTKLYSSWSHLRTKISKLFIYIIRLFITSLLNRHKYIHLNLLPPIPIPISTPTPTLPLPILALKILPINRQRPEIPHHGYPAEEAPREELALGTDVLGEGEEAAGEEGAYAAAGGGYGLGYSV